MRDASDGVTADNGVAVPRAPPLPSINEKTRLLNPSRTLIILPPGEEQRSYVLAPPKLQVYQQQLRDKEAAEKLEGKGNDDGDEEEEEEEGEVSGRFMAMLFLVYVVVALGNRLFQKLQTIPMCVAGSPALPTKACTTTDAGTCRPSFFLVLLAPRQVQLSHVPQPAHLVRLCANLLRVHLAHAAVGLGHHS